jgi:hypothetical protein
MEMADESRSVVEALDRIRGALAPRETREEESESVIMALDRIYDVLTSSGTGIASAKYYASPTTDEET